MAVENVLDRGCCSIVGATEGCCGGAVCRLSAPVEATVTCCSRAGGTCDEAEGSNPAVSTLAGACCDAAIDGAGDATLPDMSGTAGLASKSMMHQVLASASSFLCPALEMGETDAAGVSSSSLNSIWIGFTGTQVAA